MTAVVEGGIMEAPGRRPALAGPFELLCRAVLRAWCPLVVRGRDQLPPGPFIICSNHSSHLDSVALMVAAGGRFGDFGLLAAKDYFFGRPVTSRLVKPFLRLIPVPRSADRQALGRTLALCRRFVRERRGRLIIYPEGGRSRDGAIRPFKRGAAVIAAELGLPIVPAHVRGTGTVMPPGALWPRRGRIEVRFGAPVAPCRRGARGFRDTAVELQRRVCALEGGHDR